MKILSILLILLLPICSFSQLVENFDDGDFTNNPVWTGTTADFIVNASGQLQTNATIATTSYLTTANQLTDLNNKEWSFYVKQSFSGSTSNFSKIYLVADNSDLTAVQNGYYLLFGESGSSDAIKLFKIVSGVETQILAGTLGNVANSFGVGIKVLHKSTGEWELYTDYSGGTSYSLEAQSSPDMNMTANSYFGILYQYTVSNIKKNYLDNIYVGAEILDTIPPVIDTTTVVDNRAIQLKFSEVVDASIVAQTITTTPSLSIDSVVQDQVDKSLVKVYFGTNFTNGVTYNGNVASAKDLAGNTSNNLSFSFTYLVADTPQFGDVIITEFMADPTPVVGLPDAEYVEIYNRSNKYFDLTNWKIKNYSGFGKIQTKWLLPGQYVVVTSTTNQPLFINSIGATSFPSYLNNGDNIILTDQNDVLLDKLSYTLDWYQDNVKKDGGYSIERIHLNVNCSDQSNWKASVDPLGGTPGKVNSVNDTSADVTSPWIVNAITLSDSVIKITFSEPVNSTINVSDLSLSPTVGITSISQDTSHLSIFYIQLSTHLQPSGTYQLTISNYADCQGNVTSSSQVMVVLPAVPKNGDIILNELLFNPLTGGSDYIELKNVSQNIFNLNGLQLSNTKTGSSNNAIINTNYLLHPGELVVLTPDSAFQKQNYPFHGTGNFIQMPIPSMNTDISTIKIFLDSTTTLDSTTYSSKWHYQLLTDLKGKALEKINDKAPSTEASSWHTASESVDFGTPGAENSQRTDFLYNGELTLSSETISPDNDGFEDVLVMTYKMDENGYVGSVKIYDDRGRPIRDLIQNELLGNTGSFTWDGLNDKSEKAHVGTYVILFDGYHVESGKTFKLKKVVVVAGNR